LKDDQSTKTPVDRALWLQNASADDNISDDESDYDDVEPKVHTERLKSTDRQALKDVASEVQTVADKDHGQILVHHSQFILWLISESESQFIFCCEHFNRPQ
jgi:hypothetical protein